LPLLDWLCCDCERLALSPPLPFEERLPVERLPVERLPVERLALERLADDDFLGVARLALEPDPLLPPERLLDVLRFPLEERLLEA
jgi:hypothetical protein